MNDIVWPVNPVYPCIIDVSHDDIDGLNHANNGSYVKWCEQAAWEHSQALGLGIKDYQALDRGMAVRHAEYHYLAPAILNDKLIFATWLSHSAGSKMTREFYVVRQSDHKVILTAVWKLVCIEISSGKIKRLPTEFIDVYGKAVITQE
ncbi:acyl-CoA thioesterase [Neptunicella sp. SCSIO 80796]|uniref:acyl-CoA thioesterase n=1 Tax=Neptunicella plasticusilytica TaxID=3117012 RepID=UPI003A4D7C01